MVTVCRIAAVVVMIAVGVVHRVHRTRLVAYGWHRWTESVVVVAVVARTVIVTRARPNVDDYPVLIAWSLPEEGDGLEVFEGSETVEFISHLIVGHDGEGVTLADAVCRNLDGNPLDVAWTYLHPFLSVAVAFVRVEIEAYITSVGVISDILDIIVDGD